MKYFGLHIMQRTFRGEMTNLTIILLKNIIRRQNLQYTRQLGNKNIIELNMSRLGKNNIMTPC